jgi:hypothetical protein
MGQVPQPVEVAAGLVLETPRHVIGRDARHSGKLFLGRTRQELGFPSSVLRIVGVVLSGADVLDQFAPQSLDVRHAHGASFDLFFCRRGFAVPAQRGFHLPTVERKTPTLKYRDRFQGDDRVGHVVRPVGGVRLGGHEQQRLGTLHDNIKCGVIGVAMTAESE